MKETELLHTFFFWSLEKEHNMCIAISHLIYAKDV